MPEPLADWIMREMSHAAELYHRLVLVVAPAGGGKTAALQEVGDRIGASVINVNLELARRMLDLTERQRTLKASSLLHDLVGASSGDTVLLDNIEVLFDVKLKVDPLRLIQGLSRNTTVVVAWNGSVANDYVTYADPSHPEFKRYPVRDVLVVTPDPKH